MSYIDEHNNSDCYINDFDVWYGATLYGEKRINEIKRSDTYNIWQMVTIWDQVSRYHLHGSSTKTKKIFYP